MAYRKRIKIMKGVNLNISSKGVGISGGVKGFRVSAGPNGVKTTTSIPGTGFYKTTTISSNKSKKSPSSISTNNMNNNEPIKTKYSATMVIIIGVCSLIFSVPLGIILIIIGALMFRKRTIEIPDSNLSKLPENDKIHIQGLLKIVEESVAIINNTLNPEVFFSRYDLIIEKLNNLTEYEQYNIFNSSLPSIDLKNIEEKKLLAINEFINRAYQKELESASALKTEKGRQNRMNNFFTKMALYHSQMLSENIELLEKLKINS